MVKAQLKIKDMPIFMRPREKLMEMGMSALKDYELLAILLRAGSGNQDVLSLARTILKRLPLSKPQDISMENLVCIKGVGISGAAAIVAAMELSRRAARASSMPGINSPEDVVKVISFIRSKKREYFVGLYLNARNQLITSEIISIGTIDMSIAHPREVFKPAIRHNAVSVIIAHNHPSGNVEPSQEDIALTRRLIDVGVILDIQLQDHVIVTHKKYYSLQNYLSQ